jgi:hypothetical protein
MESKTEIKLGDSSLTFILLNGELSIQNENLSTIRVYKIYNIGTPKKMFTKLNVSTLGVGEYIFVYRNEYKVFVKLSDDDIYFKVSKIDLSDKFLVFGN